MCWLRQVNSMNKIKVAGLDPSMSNWGFAIADLDLDTLEISDIQLTLIETAPSKEKQLRKNSCDLERSRTLYKAIQDKTKDVAISFVEVPHGSQSARAMASYGMCMGLLASIQSYSMIQLSEAQLKIATLGRKTGTKEEAITWAINQHPEANWLRKKDTILKKNEHLADALAAIYAGMKSDDFKNALAILRFSRESNIYE